MKTSATTLAGVFTVDVAPRSDQRGSFARWFCHDDLAEIIGAREIRQINHSRTLRVGSIRGLHFQHPPHAEMKLVRCIKGKVWDVAVDLRASSPTFLRWHAEELSKHNQRLLVIPEGCAHGFQVLSPDSELLYLHTAKYEPASEDAVRFDDPTLAIAWPLPVGDVSERDRNHTLIDDSFSGVNL